MNPKFRKSCSIPLTKNKQTQMREENVHLDIIKILSLILFNWEFIGKT